MLVLTRKVGEAIVIDEKTTITIKEMSKDGVRISIDAPRSVKILRKELIESVTSINKEASVVTASALKSLIKNSKKESNE